MSPERGSNTDFSSWLQYSTCRLRKFHVSELVVVNRIITSLSVSPWVLLVAMHLLQHNEHVPCHAGKKFPSHAGHPYAWCSISLLLALESKASPIDNGMVKFTVIKCTLCLHLAGNVMVSWLSRHCTRGMRFLVDLQNPLHQKKCMCRALPWYMNSMQASLRPQQGARRCVQSLSQ